MITINTNTTAMVAQNNLLNTQSNLNDSMQKLSTGLRINSASDDAAGMQISNRMETQINGLGVAQRNANDAVSMAQTAEGAMTEITDMMNRMRDLSLQSANDTNTQDDRDAMQKEVDALATEITRVAEKTDFAGIDILNGDGSKDSSKSFSFQVGAGSNETISFNIGNMDSESLGVSGAGSNVDTAITTGTIGTGTTEFDANSSVKVDGKVIDLELSGKGQDSAITEISKKLGVDKSAVSVTATTFTIAKDAQMKGALQEVNSADVTSSVSAAAVGGLDISSESTAQTAIDTLDSALKEVDSQRADLGAVQNRLESTIDNLSNIQENMTSSQSRIKDVDFAKETTNMTSQQMMMQAGSTILSQAKSMPQYATQLLG